MAAVTASPTQPQTGEFQIKIVDNYQYVTRVEPQLPLQRRHGYAAAIHVGMRLDQQSLSIVQECGLTLGPGGRA
jgi:hypothetical protein